MRPTNQCLSGVLFESFCSAIIRLERADFPMPGDVHHAQDVSAVMQRRRDEACPKTVTREEGRVEASSFNSLLDNLRYRAVCETFLESLGCLS
jgi:hypothetical protein